MTVPDGNGEKPPHLQYRININSLNKVVRITNDCVCTRLGMPGVCFLVYCDFLHIYINSSHFAQPGYPHSALQRASTTSYDSKTTSYLEHKNYITFNLGEIYLWNTCWIFLQIKLLLKQMQIL